MSDVPVDLKTIDLLLVGRTGNGKSSTGNSILGEKKFTPRNASSSVVVEIKKESVTRDGIIFNIVDGPGIGDMGSDAPEDGRSVIDLVTEAMELNEYKFTALLIVFKYGVRFTKQEKDAVALTKSIFGDDVIREFGVIVMTHGDSFELDMDDGSDITFEKWCKEQSGDVQELFKECSSRCVLFNNKSKNDAQKKDQVDQLISMVARVHSAQKKLYTKNEFEQAERGRMKILIMIKLPELEKNTDAFLDKINQRIGEVKERIGQDGSLVALEAIQTDLQKHKEQLEKEDQGTGSVDHLILQISVMESSIKSKMDLNRRIIESQTKKPALQLKSNYDQKRNTASQPPEPGNNWQWYLAIGIGIGIPITGYLVYRYFHRGDPSP